ASSMPRLSLLNTRAKRRSRPARQNRWKGRKTMRLFKQGEGETRRLPKRIASLALAAALLGAAGFGAVRLLGSRGGGAQIVTDHVTRDTIRSTVRGTGAAAARESVSLNPPVSATVLALHVKEGDRVEAGT